MDSRKGTFSPAQSARITEMEFAQNSLRSATQDALAGKEELPNLFRGREAV